MFRTGRMARNSIKGGWTGGESWGFLLQFGVQRSELDPLGIRTVKKLRGGKRRKGGGAHFASRQVGPGTCKRELHYLDVQILGKSVQTVFP